MAHANQIMLVKTVKRRLNELLSDTGIKTVVKYTSADDMLTVTFRKISKGSAQLLDRKTTLQECLLAGNEFLSYLTSEAIESLRPRWTATTLAEELTRRNNDYDTWNGQSDRRDRYHFGFGITDCSRSQMSGVYYSLYANNRYYSPAEHLTLEEVEQQFEQHAGEASHGEYIRWRAAGEPRTRQPEPLTTTLHGVSWAEFMRQMPITGPAIQAGNSWGTAASNAQMFASGQLPDTLLGRPIIWDCDIDAPSNPEPF